MHQSICRFLALFLLTLPALTSNACTIFTATDGQSVVVGNNEDFRSETDPLVWFYPATDTDLGVMFWGFDYQQYEAEKNPQGGLNERGLFYDGTSVPHQDLVSHPDRRDVDDTFIIEAMRRCGTIDEVAALVGGMNLVGFERSQILFVDAGGDWLVLENNTMTRKITGQDQLVVGNFRHSAPELGGYPSHEHTTATEMLACDPAATAANMTGLCRATSCADARTSTIYSTVADLGQRQLHLYLFHDFDHPHVIHLDDELARGRHKLRMAELFAPRAAPLVLASYRDQGPAAGQALLMQLMADPQHNTSEGELSYLAMALRAEDHMDASLAVSDLIIDRHPGSARAHLEKGRTCLYLHDRPAALACFEAAYGLAPDDADIAWMHQHTAHPATSGNSTFRLPEHADAHLVTVRFEHEGYADLRHIMRRQDDGWVYHVDLEDGRYVYAFCVDGEFYPDPADTSGAFPSVRIKG